MSILISEFLNTPSPKGTVRLRGRDLPIRALSAGESERIQCLYVRPQPPHAREPGVHPEHGPLFVNVKDPKYCQLMERWVRRLKVLEIAAAGGLTASRGLEYSPAMDAAALERWAAAIVRQLLEPSDEQTQLTDGEIERCWNQVRDLSDAIGEGGDRVEAAKKALSLLAPEELAQVLAWCSSQSQPSSS